MSDDQFTALARLLRLKNGPAQEGARAVLTAGDTPAVAAKRLGISPNRIHNTLRACREGEKLARIVAGGKHVPR